MNLRPAAWLLLLVMAVPASQAQVPEPNSEVTVTLEGAPESLIAGGNASVGVTVELEIGGVICTAPEDVNVDIALAGTPTVPGITATLLESSMTFTIPQGQYTGNGWSDSDTTEITIEVGPAVMNSTVEYTVTATYDGGAVCASSGSVPAAENMATFSLATQSAAPVVDPEDEEGGGGGGGGGGIPGPGLPLTLVGVIALVAFLRRR